jgi:hypothetical protein
MVRLDWQMLYNLAGASTISRKGFSVSVSFEAFFEVFVEVFVYFDFYVHFL